MKKEKKDILLSLTTEDSNINEFLYCYNLFGSIPNRYIIHSSVNYDNFLDIINDLEIINHIIETDEFSINEKVLCKYNDNVYISYFLLNKGTELESFNNITFLYKNNNDLNEIDKNSLFEDFYEEETIEESYDIKTASISSGSLDFINLTFENVDNDFEFYYNEKTFKDINKAIKNIKNKNKGLSLFFGERGTGKTSIVRYLTSKIKKNVIYIPNNLIEHTINNPEFRNILSLYKSPLIVIDDSEFIFNDYNKTNIFTSNLIQMVDGIDSDSLSINFLLIFNSDEDEIDQNLLDCNNLINKVYFDYLSIDEIKELGRELGRKIKIKESSRLIDVLNNKNDKKNLIGF